MTSKIAAMSPSGGSENPHFGNRSKLERCATSGDFSSTRSMFDFDEARTGVQVEKNRLLMPDEMSFELWRELGSRVALIANCSAWWLGDWLLYGEQSYGARYEKAIADSSLSYQTLRNYAWVARTFPVSRRQDKLSFGHHAEVAALSGDEQDIWLARAERLNWSCNRLRRALRATKMATRQACEDEVPNHTRALRIDVPTERHDHWRSAAERRNCSVADWIITTLDRAAGQEFNADEF